MVHRLEGCHLRHHKPRGLWLHAGRLWTKGAKWIRRRYLLELSTRTASLWVKHSRLLLLYRREEILHGLTVGWLCSLSRLRRSRGRSLWLLRLRESNFRSTFGAYTAVCTSTCTIFGLCCARSVFVSGRFVCFVFNSILLEIRIVQIFFQSTRK